MLKTEPVEEESFPITELLQMKAESADEVSNKMSTLTVHQVHIKPVLTNSDKPGFPLIGNFEA